MSLARAAASTPPVPKGSLTSPQCGQTYPAMFSTSPITGTPPAATDGAQGEAAFREIATGLARWLDEGRA